MDSARVDQLARSIGAAGTSRRRMFGYLAAAILGELFATRRFPSEASAQEVTTPSIGPISTPRPPVCALLRLEGFPVVILAHIPNSAVMEYA
jgi:hypothetical protein